MSWICLERIERELLNTDGITIYHDQNHSVTYQTNSDDVMRDLYRIMAKYGREPIGNGASSKGWRSATFRKRTEEEERTEGHDWQ